MELVPEKRISIQVALSGFSFKIIDNGKLFSSGWQGLEQLFVSRELQSRYDKVEISLFTPKISLVPKLCFSQLNVRQALSEVVVLDENDIVDYIEIDDLNAVLLFSNSIGESISKVISQNVLTISGESVRVLPEMYYMLHALNYCEDYNKIVVSYKDDYVYIVIAQGKTLLLVNAYKAKDFTTSLYYIFLALKSLQLSIEQSVIRFRTPLSSEEELVLYRYFKGVEEI